VRRIVNPKGVWRDWNETGKFYVQLTHLIQSVGTDIQNSADQFVTFVSQGPWSAEVVGSNTGWVRLTKGAKSREVGGKIYGDTGSEIEFYYEPTDKLSSADAEPRCAMIRIRYHNFSCEHTIFVRQGYAPLAVASGQKRWYSYNMRTQTERTQSPLEEGSMFKWRSWNIPINATNNKRGGVYGFNQNLWSSPLWIYPTNQDDKGAKAKWREIGRDAAQGGTWDNATIDGKSVQIATVDDYLALRNNENVFYGYGVLYGGTSDRVQMAVKDAYGYYYDEKACVECSSTTKRPATKYSSLSAHPVTEDAEEKPLKEKTQVSESYAMPTGSNSTIARQIRLNAVLSSTGFI